MGVSEHHHPPVGVSCRMMRVRRTRDTGARGWWVLPALALAAAIAVAGCGSATPSLRQAASGAGATPATTAFGVADETPTVSAGATLTPGSNVIPTLGPTQTPTPAATPQPPAATAKPNPPAPPVGRLPNFRHVYLIIFENREYADIVGSSRAPYINSLIGRYGLATNFYGERHPSEPNYIALTSGSTQGITDDGVYNLGARSLFDQIEASGRTWHAYQQGYPGNCFTGASSSGVADGVGRSGAYARKHDPAVSFTAISGSATRCAKITNLASFDPAAANFEFITPNMINDMHDGTVADGDNFLKAFLPLITGSRAFANSVVFVTFDEGTTNLKGGGRIPTIVITPKMTPGYQASSTYNHYSILRTIEQAWGLPYLGSAASAAWMQFPY
jgi:phosphatidylinositol-3-phosphatase